MVAILLEVGLVVGRSLLVLLVLGDEVVHVGLGLGELHLVHALARVPVQEGLAPEHGRELFRDALEQLLDGRRVADEGGRHLQSARRDVAHGRLDVVRDPLDKVGRVFVLHRADPSQWISHTGVVIHDPQEALMSVSFSVPFQQYHLGFENSDRGSPLRWVN